MKRLLFFLSAAAALTATATAGETASRWWEPYAGEEANGPHVLGFWRFDTEAEPAQDSSANSLAGQLRGAKWSAAGKSGGCLECGAGFPIADEPHGLRIGKSPVLAPGGPFTLEMWLRPKAAEAFPADYAPIVADCKYVPDNHTGFLWSMTKEDSGGRRRFQLEAGLGARSESWFSEPFHLEPEIWQHAAFVFDGAGTVSFFLGGAETGRDTKPSASTMAAPSREFVIGDRIGSRYRGFPGWIDEVRFTAGTRDFRPVKIETESDRPVFRRMTENAVIRARVLGLSPEPMPGLKISISGAKQPGPKDLTLDALKPGAAESLEIPVDTSLRPGEYIVEITVETPGWGGAETVHRTTSGLPFVIVPRPLPHRMPVVMWGLGGTEGVLRAMPKLKEIGFTHCLGLRADYSSIWEGGAEAPVAEPGEVRDARNMLDRALENGLGIVATVAPGRWLRDAEAGEPFRRIDRQGKRYPREDVSGLFPRVQQFCFDTGAALARTYGSHPAFAAALLHTEVRGESQLSFHPIEREAAKAALGFEIPETVVNKNGVQHEKLPDFPADRVIADDDPILASLRWFWTGGDGWNALNTRLHEGFKSVIGREDFWTFHDPAVRVPSIHGSGGKADVLSHWTYSYPDPIRIGLCADELFEMARVNGFGQEVMKMTQVIWYRSQTAPEKLPDGVEASPWVDRDPGAAYITIAPMHLREAFWWKLARPIKGIMYHGWGSLVETDSPGSYTFTNGNTAGELRRLIGEVVEPLGPALLQVPDAPSDVAFLESFTSQMFARRGTYGWNHKWAGDLYQALMWARLQPRVLYEESLLGGGIDGARILVMGDCDVLTKSVVERVRAFQKSGGIVVGDAELCPAIQPDILAPRYERIGDAAADRAALQALAEKLRADLAGRYEWPLSSDNPDVVTRRRIAGTADYVFAVNDRREAGAYVGNYGRVMEDGLPSSATLRLRRDKGHAYDLRERREVKCQTNPDGTLAIPVSLGPCEGRVFLVTGEPVAGLAIQAPEKAAPGASVDLRITVTDPNGKPVDAVIPIDLRITDPEGAEMERSGFYGAAAGKLRVVLDLASNDRTGLWTIRATEGATGREQRAYLRVEGK